jgi:hypothetical protein
MPIPIYLENSRVLSPYIDSDRIPRGPGIYVFGRRWGQSFEALYVGKAESLPSRVAQQMNNLKLMRHVFEARQGQRVVVVGTFEAKPGQQSLRCLPILERAFIRYFLAKGDDLVNIHGTRLRQHSIKSTKVPMHFVPRVALVDRVRAAPTSRSGSRSPRRGR